MSELLDSGARREFASGAVRDIAEGKGRCDLLPLGVIGFRYGFRELVLIEDYLRGGDTLCLFNAVWVFTDKNYGCDIATMLLDVSKQYEAGALKYEDRDWEKGIPSHCYIDSAVRHYLKHLRGDKDEPHGRAFVWNLLCAIWNHENLPLLVDLPFAEVAKNENRG